MPSTVVAPRVPTLVLEPSELAPSLARRFVGVWFREWGISEFADALVVVSELVTNSLLHGDGTIVVRVVRDGRDGRPVIEVQDDGAGRPEVQPENCAATSGRGLLMVSLLALDWGTRLVPDGGKVTWAKC
ncbi:ATP-binding protein [Actinomadura chibensis]|uniref:ATP-binding protein n=1 Tax=Actinomadura chibensis TaxID=392828 RepID=A0A5D0NXB3_9ACTN|nr:ATP-binding protein [Actinomadura chibensis]TYB48631.1 ATP-binding protein [Actinomadura chibensis]